MNIGERNWLNLGEASRFLGVHPTTLRVWADQGQVRAFRTPGGHRRFSRQDLQHFVTTRQSGEDIAPNGLAQHLFSHTRRELAHHPDVLAIWQEHHDEAARDKQRESGRRLLGLTIQYMARERGRTAVVRDARGIGAAYGKDAALAGFPLAHTARIILFFRDSLNEAIQQRNKTGSETDAEELRLGRDLYYILDEVLVAALDAYESTLQRAGHHAIPGKLSLAKETAEESRS
ncbi:MAG: helix-turn-helix domain-containing protein [Anaerolineae bacterium]|nr:helix-turn-helix domain-containing protein [Anaerolineae bacterium]